MTPVDRLSVTELTKQPTSACPMKRQPGKMPWAIPGETTPAIRIARLSCMPGMFDARACAAGMRRSGLQGWIHRVPGVEYAVAQPPAPKTPLPLGGILARVKRAPTLWQIVIERCPIAGLRAVIGIEAFACGPIRFLLCRYALIDVSRTLGGKLRLACQFALGIELGLAGLIGTAVAGPAGGCCRHGIPLRRIALTSLCSGVTGRDLAPFRGCGLFAPLRGSMARHQTQTQQQAQRENQRSLHLPPHCLESRRDFISLSSPSPEHLQSIHQGP